LSLVTPKLGICPRCLFFCYSITLRALPKKSFEVNSTLAESQLNSL